MEVYKELLMRVGATVKNYRTDLDIDRQEIENNPGTSFIHAARENGTHIWFFHAADTFPRNGERVPFLFGTIDRIGLLNSVTLAMECVRDNNHTALWHYYDGRKIRSVSYATAIMVARSYVNGIIRQWEEQGRRAAA